MTLSLVIGMNIGKLYKNVLLELGSTVYTIDPDPNKNANFLSINDAIKFLIKVGYHPRQIDTVHICTPNWTHESIATEIAPYSKIVFIDKPGLLNEDRLYKLHKMFTDTRFMMVKNNMWRDNIKEMQQSANESRSIHLNWINSDRVPSPGTWFTTKDLAFGGVSRDLMPHLLSLVVAFFPNTYKSLDLIGNGKCRNWSLNRLTNTQYGTVKADGIYDVDDLAWLDFSINIGEYQTIKIRLEANWRTIMQDDRSVTFDTGRKQDKFELGLCPEYAYKNMIKDCINNLYNQQFWNNQYEIDLWIHRMVNEI